MGRFVLNKLRKTKVLLKNGDLQKYVPVTRIMSSATLHDMLQQYKMVYLKPNIGMFGHGVIRAEWKTDASEPYQYQSGEALKTFVTFESMYQSLQRETKGRRYLAQKGIYLLKHKGRRFDLRVMVQKNPNKKWETTGIIGRVAAPRKIVTNYHSGGKLTSVEALISPYVSKSGRKEYIERLSILGRRIATQMNKAFPGVKEIGVDVALDKSLHPWVLEVNTAPDPYIFRVLKDKRIFAKVMRYHRWINSNSGRKSSASHAARASRSSQTGLSARFVSKSKIKRSK